MTDVINKSLARRNRDAITEEYKIKVPRCYGAKAAIVGRAGYPACALWLPDQRYLTMVVPRGDKGGWSACGIVSTLKELLEEYQIQVDTVVYEIPWLGAHYETVHLLQTCERAAVGWADLHEDVMAKEVKLYVRAPMSFWTETYGPGPDAYRKRPGRPSPQDFVDPLDHFLIFAGADAGRVALKLERDEIMREDPEIA